MSKSKEIIKLKEDGSLKFGDYTAIEKQKVADFNFNGTLVSVKTHKDITVLKKNDNLFIETVPGANIDNFVVKKGDVSFDIIGFKQTMVTLGVHPDESYQIYVDGHEIETQKSKLSGKISVSLDIDGTSKRVEFKKI